MRPDGPGLPQPIRPVTHSKNKIHAELAFWGRFSAGELTAVCFVGGAGGLLVPSLSPSHHLADIGRHLSGRLRQTPDVLRKLSDASG